MKRSGYPLGSKNSILYLIEPVFAFIAVLLLVALFVPVPQPPRLRMMELHAQDVLSILQVSKAWQVAEWLDGGNELEGTVSALTSELNAYYGYTLEVSEGDSLRKTEHDKKSTAISAERLIVYDGRVFTARLTLWL